MDVITGNYNREMFKRRYRNYMKGLEDLFINIREDINNFGV